MGRWVECESCAFPFVLLRRREANLELRSGRASFFAKATKDRKDGTAKRALGLMGLQLRRRWASFRRGGCRR
jgi:hypothetical protein